MKTLDEIISRSDYARLNTALIDRAQELAKIICQKMQELDQEELYEPHSDVAIRVVTRKSNISSYTFLGLDKTDECGNHYSVSLQDRGSFYVHNDFHCWLSSATSEEYLKFLNSAKEFICMLDELETEKCNQLNQALELTKDL